MILLLIILTLFNFAIGFKTADVCFVKEKPNQTQKEIKCNGAFKFNCTLNYCTIDKHSCQSLIDLSVYVRTLQSKSTIQKISNMVNKIQTCSNSNKKWRASDICINQNSCIDYNISNRCKCGRKYSFSCSSQFCALNKETCLNFILENKKTVKLAYCSKILCFL